MLKTINTNLFLFTLVMTPFLSRSNDVTLQYIQKYKTIAISEMQRVGIPASIKMAQGILESNSGQSTLARQSNNHFGIKCGNNWKGEEVYRHDDDYQNGLLIRSCFRAYTDPLDSYLAHSEFLANPHSKRYKFLFSLDVLDYKAWANGLKKSGYATDPAYPSKLINIIEKYDLHVLDYAHDPLEEEPLLVAIDEEPAFENQSDKIPSELDDVRPVSTTTIQSGLHNVRNGQRMEDIARLNGVEVRKLYFMNRMPYGSQPRPGETLVTGEFLQFKKPPRLLPAVPGSNSSAEEFLFEETISLSSDQ